MPDCLFKGPFTVVSIVQWYLEQNSSHMCTDDFVTDGTMQCCPLEQLVQLHEEYNDKLRQKTGAQPGHANQLKEIWDKEDGLIGIQYVFALRSCVWSGMVWCSTCTQTWVTDFAERELRHAVSHCALCKLSKAPPPNTHTHTRKYKSPEFVFACLISSACYTTFTRMAGTVQTVSNSFVSLQVQPTDVFPHARRQRRQCVWWEGNRSHDDARGQGKWLALVFPKVRFCSWCDCKKVLLKKLLTQVIDLPDSFLHKHVWCVRIEGIRKEVLQSARIVNQCYFL